MPQGGRYHIARKIADGGMAEIFLGTQHGAEGFERPVVLKRILAPLVADPQFRNMLIDEAHVAMGLNHSNIVQVLDLGHVHGRYFLVMEFVDGWDLGQIVARAAVANFPLPPEIILYIAAETCRALAYAHSRTRDGEPLALVHRDVSPQNVLISEQGEVKLTDFGIAKAMGRRERTHQGVIKGKLAFMSPEQASGYVLDNRSDLFSLGTILYQLFTGRRPFDAPTDMESIVRVRECRFTPPEEAKPGLHPEMAAIIRRAMQAKPADRFQSADEMLLAIENVQRTVYKPAGQTELKRWLAELQVRDHVQSFGRSQPPHAIPSLEEELDVGEGADVVFDQSDLMEISEIMRGMQPTIAAPAPPVLPTAEESARAAKTAVAVPAPLAHKAFPVRWFGLGLAALASLAVGGWLLFAPAGEESSKPVPGTHAKTAAPPATGPAQATAAAKPAAAKPPAPAVVPDASPTHPVASVDARPAEPAPAALEEEDLLKLAEPESSDRVIGEDDAVTKAKPKPAAAKGVRPPEVVSVHVDSSPAGAVVSIGKRVFGRAPLHLRFRPGITYELTFVKQGYLSTTKRFSVSHRPNQTVKVALKKKPEKKPLPAPKKSLLRRIFGG
jgi:serine/threonine protein kinase